MYDYLPGYVRLARIMRYCTIYPKYTISPIRTSVRLSDYFVRLEPMSASTHLIY